MSFEELTLSSRPETLSLQVKPLWLSPESTRDLPPTAAFPPVRRRDRPDTTVLAWSVAGSSVQAALRASHYTGRLKQVGSVTKSDNRTK
jgi:hypothetical protein